MTARIDRGWKRGHAGLWLLYDPNGVLVLASYSRSVLEGVARARGWML